MDNRSWWGQGGGGWQQLAGAGSHVARMARTGRDQDSQPMASSQGKLGNRGRHKAGMMHRARTMRKDGANKLGRVVGGTRTLGGEREVVGTQGRNPEVEK